MSQRCDNHVHFSRKCPDCMAKAGLPPGTPPEKKREPTFLEEVVWDALKRSKCPKEHRWQGPSQDLPCRWCRTAHAVILVLRRMAADNVSPETMAARMEEMAGWKLDGPERPSPQ